MKFLPACVAVAGVAPAQTKNNRDLHESAAAGLRRGEGPPSRRWSFLPPPFHRCFGAGAAVAGIWRAHSNRPRRSGRERRNARKPRLRDQRLLREIRRHVADGGQRQRFNRTGGDVVADGHVRIEKGGQIWLGDHINYNFKTHQMRSEQFRTGKPPVFAAGSELAGRHQQQGLYRAAHPL